jgi:hypothetical protein
MEIATGNGRSATSINRTRFGHTCFGRLCTTDNSSECKKYRRNCRGQRMDYARCSEGLSESVKHPDRQDTTLHTYTTVWMEDKTVSSISILLFDLASPMKPKSTSRFRMPGDNLSDPCPIIRTHCLPLRRCINFEISPRALVFEKEQYSVPR